ncbi:high mobility group B protein 15-like [Bidens hawaiensis]|uniref:high mobility group B protein 15-like n=1 Tax=Bidens hawaiensis TaxID=980011 RepID=UPI004049A18D
MFFLSSVKKHLVQVLGGDVAMAASSSTNDPMQYYLYPPPIAYEDIIASRNLFLDVLGKFHAAMGTKFKIPVVGGRDLDLHRLFMEVTARGGIRKVLEEKKWKEVTNCFTFPPSATNSSFILRKYYLALVHHFEQVYYFKAKAWTPIPTDAWQIAKTTPASTSGTVLALPEIQETALKRQNMITEEETALSKGPLHPLIGLPVTGILDGKFESGYLCTVTIGGEQLQGVLYQAVQSQNPLYNIPNHEGQVTMNPTQGLTMLKSRRRRRKKSEIRKRDPAHPKPNRSGYNFFFAEHHARLKSLHTGKDRAVSRMIGEEWNKLTESEKAVYQEKAVKDKERYRSEMENYKEGVKRGQNLTTSTPLQQQYLTVNSNIEINGANSHKLNENEPNSQYCDDDDESSFEGDGEEISGKIFNLEMGAENIDQEGQQKTTPVVTEPLVYENEFTRIQENDSKRVEKIPDMNDEIKTKSSDHRDHDLEMFDENGPLVNNEGRNLESLR